MKKANPYLTEPPSLMNRSKCLRSMEMTYYYTDTDSMWLDSTLRHRFDRLGEELGMLKDESQKKKKGKVVGPLVLQRWNPGNKEYCNIYINPQNEVFVSIKSKGISVNLMKLSSYINSFLNEERRSTTVSMPNKIKSFNYQSADKFMAVKSVNMTRTFCKTPYSSRVRCDKDLNEKWNGEWSLPYGHRYCEMKNKPRKTVRPPKEKEEEEPEYVEFDEALEAAICEDRMQEELLRDEEVEAQYEIYNMSDIESSEEELVNKRRKTK